MAESHRRTGTRLTGRLVVPLVSLVAAGCAAGAQSARHDAVTREFALAAPPARPGEPLPANPFEGQRVLDRAALVRTVIERNPSVESGRQAWREALARYPQATALDDPSLAYTVAPGSIAAEDVRFGQVLQIGQRFPWPGKLALQGAVATAEAEARREDLQTTRLHLARVASMLFDEWYAVARSLEINGQHVALLERLKQSAEAQYSVGRGSQQDPLQAEVELAHLEHHRIVLGTRRGIATAQINGLLHRAPDAAIPAPPASLAPPDPPTQTTAQMQERALAARPELRARDARVRGAESAVDVAERAYFPDFTVGGAYNSMWMGVAHQFTVGASINVPLQIGRRDAAVDEAEARLTRSRSDLEGLVDDVRLEVERARLRAVEAHHVVALYESRLLPAGRDQVAAAEAGFATGRNSFLALIDAERNLRTVELEHQQALATAWSRTAELDHALGQTPGGTRQGGTP